MPLVAINLYLPAAADTEILGAALAAGLPLAAAPPDVVGLPGAGPPAAAGLPAAPGFGAVLYLQGDLGAGKTTCVRSLLRALGVTGLVRSPTYTLVETYPTAALTCVHVDLYRLGSESEAEGLGLRDLAVPGTLLMIEWPERGGGAVPRADATLSLSYEGQSRQACLSPCTDIGERWLQNLGDDTRITPYVSNIT
jgi:tRNA threonylcarbamoyladenosine biosynthesis protein TsaE